MSIIGNDIKKAAGILKNGGLVAIPTETVYGLAGNALDPDVTARIFEVKNRPFFDPLIVHTYGIDHTYSFVTEIPQPAVDLAKKFWPGPLTLLLPKKNIIPDLVTSGMQRVAVRVPKHKMTNSLLQMVDFPLVAPSANPFGYVSPTTAAHVEMQMGDKIDYILDGGECMVGIESTIVGFDDGSAVIYRLGGLEKEQIESVLGKVSLLPHSTSEPQSPGMLKSHYSPLKQLILGNDLGELIGKYSERKIGILRFQAANGLNGVQNEIILSESGDLREAAKKLFAALRKLDGMDIDLILAEKAPETGLGLAINDRLKRASI